MSRRRYVTSRISADTRVRTLAMDYGDFAALLYTWLIPHAEDDGSFPAEPGEILLTLVPQRGKTEADIEAALAGMTALGLIALDADGRRYHFPGSSFYRYQTYISEPRRKTRRTPPVPDDPGAIEGPPLNAADQRETTQNAPRVRVRPPVRVSPSADTSTGAEEPHAPARATGLPPNGVVERAIRLVPKPAGGADRHAEACRLIAQAAPDLVIYGAGDRNHAAVNGSNAPPAEIAEAYVDLHRGEWPDEHVLKRGSLAAVVENLGGHRAWKEGKLHGAGKSGGGRGSRTRHI